MSHAIVVHVDLNGRTREQDEKLLNEQIVPGAKGQPGFERGVWLRAQDGTKGMAVMVFDSEENVNQMRDALDTMRPSDAPPITATDVFAVIAQA